MKKITFLLMTAFLLAACSVDPVENEADFTGVDAKTKAPMTVQTEAFVVPENICAGEAAEFCLRFPQDYAGSKTKQTNVQVQIYVGDDPATSEIEEEWIQLEQGNYDTEFCFDYTFPTPGDYLLRYKIGGGGPGGAFTDVSVSAQDCSDCDENFSYVENEDGTHTFTYIPSEFMTSAEVVFTFAQSATVAGFGEGWISNGQTYQKEMDLIACETYSWTLQMTKACMGNTGNNNLWTDFKVNEISKKGDLPNIVRSCK